MTNIEDVKLGDTLIGFDENSKKISETKVVKLTTTKKKTILLR